MSVECDICFSYHRDRDVKRNVVKSSVLVQPRASLAGKTFDAAITNQKKIELHTGMKMANLFMAFMWP